MGHCGAPWDKRDSWRILARRRILAGRLGPCLPRKALPHCPGPLPTNDTKLVLSTSIQIPKQKIRLPRTCGEEKRILWWASRDMRWGSCRKDWGPG